MRVCLGNRKQQMEAQNAGKEVQDEVGGTGLRGLWSFKLITKVLGEPFRVFKWVSDVISFASERCIWIEGEECREEVKGCKVEGISWGATAGTWVVAGGT